MSSTSLLSLKGHWKSLERIKWDMTMIRRLGKIDFKNINTCIYAYYSQNPYKVQFERVTSFLITQSSTFRGNPEVPDAKVISNTYQNPGAGNWSCRHLKLKMLFFYSMRKGNNSGGKNSNKKKKVLHEIMVAYLSSNEKKLHMTFWGIYFNNTIEYGTRWMKWHTLLRNSRVKAEVQ